MALVLVKLMSGSTEYVNLEKADRVEVSESRRGDDNIQAVIHYGKTLVFVDYYGDKEGVAAFFKALDEATGNKGGGDGR